MKSFESTPETDPFFYHGSEAQKADLAASQAAQEGKWESFMADTKEPSLKIVLAAEMPVQPPMYRDFRRTT